MSNENFQPPEDPAHDEFLRGQQAEAYWEKQLTDAYAEGRKDEREEWIPVLAALVEMVAMCATFDLDGDRQTVAIEAAEKAIAKATGSAS